MLKLPSLIEKMVVNGYVKREDAESFLQYDLAQTCTCGAIIVQEDSKAWADLQGFHGSGSHTHAPQPDPDLIRATHGLAFNEALTHVVLIENNTKDKSLLWHGKLMGLGGKIEPGESSLDAMVREFKEESGALSQPSDWDYYATLRGKGFEFDCYYTTAVDLSKVHTAEPDKPVKAYRLSNIYGGLHALMYGNVRWLMEMAVTLINGQEQRAERFIIEEEGSL